MANIPNISEAEWEIMKIIWRSNPITSEQIIKLLQDETSWSQATIKTFIIRLVKKEAIGFKKEGRNYHYYPLISEDECIKEENKSFLKRVYNGAANMLFMKFLEHESFTDEELDELEALLKSKKKK